MKTFDPARAAAAVPERMRLDQSWQFGTCKRCLTNGTQRGDVIVRTYGQGWWHDRCYHVVNPKFYDGLIDDAPNASEVEQIPF